jgi:hypothetical protein
MTASRITIADITLAVVLALFGAYLVVFHRPSGPGARVEIQTPGRATEVFDLREARTVHVAGLRGETVIAIAGGRVSFLSSSCPNKICVRRGEISRCGEWIACVPNGVAATITGKRGYDGITP